MSLVAGLSKSARRTWACWLGDSQQSPAPDIDRIREMLLMLREYDRQGQGCAGRVPD